MSLNKQGVDTISWCTHSWNPITGCYNGCWFCYSRRIMNRFKQSFKPTFHRKRLRDVMSKKRLPPGSKVFVCSMGDLIGEWVNPDWINSVIASIDARPDVIFQILTKNPSRYKDFDWPANCWLGVSLPELKANNPEMQMLKTFRKAAPKDRIRYVAVCPCLFPPSFNKGIFKGIDWVVIEPLHGYGLGRQQETEGFIPLWVKVARKSGSRIWVKGLSFGPDDPAIGEDWFKRMYPQQWPKDYKRRSGL